MCKKAWSTTSFLPTHNIFVFHLKFGGFEETHFETRIGQDRRERETMCWKAWSTFFQPDSFDSHNIFILHLKFGSFEKHMLNQEKCKTTHKHTKREREREREKQCVGMHDEHSSKPILLIPIVSSFCIWKFGGFKTHMFWNNLLCRCCQMRGSRMYCKSYTIKKSLQRPSLDLKEGSHKTSPCQAQPQVHRLRLPLISLKQHSFHDPIPINPWVCKHIDMYGTKPRFPPPWISLRFLVMKWIWMVLVQICIHCLVTRNWKN